MRGIDVSNHNGNINWQQVKKTGIECVYIKSTEGTTYEDPYLKVNYNAAKAAGLLTGFYHFLVGSSQPETQADNFYNNIKDKESDLLPCLDLEHSNNEPDDFMDYALRFIDRFKVISHMNICIYACPSFIEEKLDKRLIQYHLWCAHYGVDKPGFTKVWGSAYAGHQYSEEGSIAGITGSVDLNNFNHEILNNESKIGQATATVSDNIYTHLQEELNKQGFRDKNGNILVVDGIAGELTLSACPLVKIGARGNITKWIQEQVHTDADGIFGSGTEEAVKKYQKEHNLIADGIIGENTWRALFKE